MLTFKQAIEALAVIAIDYQIHGRRPENRALITVETTARRMGEMLDTGVDYGFTLRDLPRARGPEARRAAAVEALGMTAEERWTAASVSDPRGFPPEYIGDAAEHLNVEKYNSQFALYWL